MNRNGRRQLHRSVGLTTWEWAAALSTQANNSDGNIRSQINQAQALQELGLYRRSIARLISLTQTAARSASPDLTGDRPRSLWLTPSHYVYIHSVMRSRQAVRLFGFSTTLLRLWLLISYLEQ